VSQLHVISLVNQKGGVGKTNATANIGAELAARGYRVLVIDGDPQQSLTNQILGNQAAEADPRAGLAEVLGFGLRRGSARPKINGLAIEAPEYKFRILASDFDGLDNVQMDLSRNPTRLFDLAEAISDLEGALDFVLFDSPPNYGPLTLSGLYAATNVIIPIDSNKESTDGFGLLSRTLREVSDKIRPVPILAIIATKYKRGNSFHPAVIDGVRAAFPNAPLYTIRDTIDVPRAVAFNRPVRTYNPKSGATGDFRVLADAIEKAVIPTGVPA